MPADLTGDVLTEAESGCSQAINVDVLGSDVNSEAADNDGAQLGGGGILRGTAKADGTGSNSRHEFFQRVISFFIKNFGIPQRRSFRLDYTTGAYEKINYCFISHAKLGTFPAFC